MDNYDKTVGSMMERIRCVEDLSNKLAEAAESNPAKLTEAIVINAAQYLRDYAIMMREMKVQV